MPVGFIFTVDWLVLVISTNHRPWIHHPVINFTPNMGHVADLGGSASYFKQSQWVVMQTKINSWSRLSVLISLLHKSSNWLGFSCVMRYLWSLQPLGFRNRNSLLLVFLFSPFLLEQWKMWIPGNLFSFLIFHFFFQEPFALTHLNRKLTLEPKVCLSHFSDLYTS